MEVIRFTIIVVLLLYSIPPSKPDTTPHVGAIVGGGGGSATGGDAHSMPCIQKLMPCQPYLHSVTPPPPASCCMPLREIVEKDVTCLCSVFNNGDMLKSLNLTKENALDLPKACGAKADVSKCKASAGTTPSSAPLATEKTPPASSTESNSTGDSASSTTTKSSNSASDLHFAFGLVFGSAIVAIIFF